MKHFYYIDDKGYPVSYESKTGIPLDISHKEFALVNGVYEPEEFRIAEEKRILDEDLNAQISNAKTELASLDWINSKYTREVQVLKSITDEEYHLKYQTEYTRMVELVTLINELEVQLGSVV